MWQGVLKACGALSTWSGEPRTSFPCRPFVCVAGRLAGWGHLPVYVLFVCLCLGEVSRGPLPTWPSLCLCRGPKPALCPCVLALWFCLCVCVCVCSWCCGLCISVPMWLCYGLYESAPSMCLFGGLSLHTSVGAVPLAIPERGRTPLQLHQ